MKFTKHDAGKLKRVGNSWRKPTGKKNKTKVGKKGHKKMPSKGFMSPASKRGKIAGKIPVRIFNLKDVEKLRFFSYKYSVLKDPPVFVFNLYFRFYCAS